MDHLVSYEEYAATWLEDIKVDNPSTIEMGCRFAYKLLSQWQEEEDSASEIFYCDGSGDGGIDLAFLERDDSSTSAQEGTNHGDAWHLVQSKYGSAFRGPNTLVEEGRKVIETLAGKRSSLSSVAQELVEKLINFQAQRSPNDRIYLVFATQDQLNEDEKRALDDVRAIGRNRLGELFDVYSISLRNIHQRLQERETVRPTLVHLRGNMVEASDDLLVGTVSLTELYQFLREYRSETGDLDQIYDKNVRRFLGSGRKVNVGIANTLIANPEKFGLYNNGITIVAADYLPLADGRWELMNPYIVNGCQTTRTIWQVFQARFEAGGTGNSDTLTQWRKTAGRGVVVTKIVRVGDDEENLLVDITSFTNTQNSVTDKDFLGLRKDFQKWKEEMDVHYGVFLEIQRGDWDSRRALQKQRPRMRQLSQHSSAFDLLKVYGSGWLGEAGHAFGRNAEYLPSGPVFTRIKERRDGQRAFGVEDLYAAFLLQRGADLYQFGRSAIKPTRRQTRFLFYLVAIDLLRGVMRKHTASEPTYAELTDAFICVSASQEALEQLLGQAIEAVDEYMTPSADDTMNTIFAEPLMVEKYQDTNGFLKSDYFGKSESCPRLRSLMTDYLRGMIRGQPSPRALITQAIYGEKIIERV
jgi:hypothetical protein